MSVDPLEPAPPAALPDHEIVRRVRAGDTSLFEILMRRHNPRVCRAARAVLRDESDVEDVMQQAMSTPSPTSISSRHGRSFPPG